MRKHRDLFFALILLFTDLFIVAMLSFLAMGFEGNLTGRVGLLIDSESILAKSMYIPIIDLLIFPILLLSDGYRMPRKWGFGDTIPILTRTVLILSAVTVVITTLLWSFLSSSNSRIGNSILHAIGLILCLYCGLSLTRLLIGKTRLLLFNRDIWILKSLILSNGTDSDYLLNRIRQNKWLGEYPILFSPQGNSPSLQSSDQAISEIIHQHCIDIIWLTPPPNNSKQSWLPNYFHTKEGNKLTWRMLPEHFSRITRANTAHLTLSQIESFHRRIEHGLALPILSVVMIGSRGVPARYSGIETYIEEIGSCLAKQGAKVVVYCHRRYITERGTYKGMELRFVPTIPTKHLETIIHTFISTLHALLFDEEIFHYHALGPSTISWLPRLLGKKVVVSVQGLDWQRAKWGVIAKNYLKFGEWSTVHFPNTTIVVSKTLLQYYNERYHKHKNVIYIPNGFAHPIHREPSMIRNMYGLDKRQYILFVGRLVPEKGCHTLIQAYKKLDTEIKLVFAGTVTFDQNYRQLLSELSADSPDIKFIGFVQDEILQELYSNAYLVVHPSELEGLSIALLEAISYANCVLVSDKPENIEAILGNGEIFKTGDVDDLANNLAHLIENPGYVEEIREHVRSQLQRMLDWETIASLTLRAYQDLLVN